MASWANMLDTIWGVVDGYTPLTNWLAARGGRKCKFTATERLPMDLAQVELPALMVYLAKAGSEWRSNAQLATSVSFALEMLSDSRDEREALDFAWHVWQALSGQKTTNFGLANLLTWRMEGGPLERTFAKTKAAVLWKMRLAVTLTVVE